MIERRGARVGGSETGCTNMQLYRSRSIQQVWFPGAQPGLQAYMFMFILTVVRLASGLAYLQADEGAPVDLPGPLTATRQSCRRESLQGMSNAVC